MNKNFYNLSNRFNSEYLIFRIFPRNFAKLREFLICAKIFAQNFREKIFREILTKKLTK
jgi:hypothetical protein